MTSTFESELRNSRCGKFEFHPSSCNFGQSFLPLPTVLPSAFQNSEVRSLSTTNRGRVENGERAKRRMRERNGFSIQARVIGSWRSANAESAEETVPHTLNSKPRLLESKRQTKRLTSDKEAQLPNSIRKLLCTGPRFRDTDRSPLLRQLPVLHSLSLRASFATRNKIFRTAIRTTFSPKNAHIDFVKVHAKDRRRKGSRRPRWRTKFMYRLVCIGGSEPAARGNLH